jgi:hypothetical protein
MPTFATPEPISVELDLGAGDVRIAASDREDTVVEVRPGDPASKRDALAAEEIRVEYGDGRLLVAAPRPPWRRALGRGAESVAVRIDLPSGSRLHGAADAAPLHCSGRLQECRYETKVGDIHLEEAGTARLRTQTGVVTWARTPPARPGSGARRG